MNDVYSYIQKQLGMKAGDNVFNIELINARLKEMADCKDHLEYIRDLYICELMRGWSRRLSADFPECKKSEFLEPGKIINTGITIPFEGVPDALSVGIQKEDRKLYYGITNMPTAWGLRDKMREAMSFVNADGDFIKGCDWLYYKYTSFKDGYEGLKGLIEELICSYRSRR